MVFKETKFKNIKEVTEPLKEQIPKGSLLDIVMLSTMRQSILSCVSS